MRVSNVGFEGKSGPKAAPVGGTMHPVGTIHRAPTSILERGTYPPRPALLPLSPRAAVSTRGAWAEGPG